MKIKVYVVDIPFPRWAKVAGCGLALIAALIGGSAIARAAVQNTFAANQTISASAMNSNFADLDSRLSTVQTQVTTVQNAQADFATQAQITSLRSDVTALQAQHPLNVFLKDGNNGSISCDDFCAGANYGTVGTCVGAKRLDNGVYLACGSGAGAVISPELACYCSRP